MEKRIEKIADEVADILKRRFDTYDPLSDVMMTPKEAAALLSVEVSVLGRWRSKNKVGRIMVKDPTYVGPPHIVVGGSIRYPAALLRVWIMENVERNGYQTD